MFLENDLDFVRANFLDYDKMQATIACFIEDADIKTDNAFYFHTVDLKTRDTLEIHTHSELTERQISALNTAFNAAYVAEDCIYECAFLQRENIVLEDLRSKKFSECVFCYEEVTIIDLEFRNSEIQKNKLKK